MGRSYDYFYPLKKPKKPKKVSKEEIAAAKVKAALNDPEVQRRLLEAAEMHFYMNGADFQDE